MGGTEMRKYLPGAIGVLLLTSPAFAFNSEDRIDVTTGFAEDEDLSGIACSDPVGTWPRNCVVVVDEGIAVQRSTITISETGYHLAAGERLALFGFDDDEVKEPFVGTAPQLSCPAGLKKANEHDSEGITFVADLYFVAGSHGCGRNNHAARESAFLVARFGPDTEPGDTLTPAGEITFRLNEVLTTDPAL